MVSGSTPDDGRCLQLLACFPKPENEDDGLRHYSRQMAALLQGSLHWQSAENGLGAALSKDRSSQYDLLLLNEARWLSWLQRSDNTAVQANRFRQQNQPAILLVRQPCWPLRRLLLIIRGEATDKATIEWGVHLTRHTQASLTILVVKSPLLPDREQFVANALKANTIPGQYIRSALHQLAVRQVDGVLKLSHRLPEQQVQLEVSQSHYDLIILGSEPRGRLFYWRLDSLLRPMLQWTQQSVLITGAQCPFDECFVKTGEEAACL